MSTGYKIDNQEGAYFITLQIVNWADLFSRQVYRDIVINNLQYCIANKGLIVYAYVIMSNHIHLLVQSSNGQLSNTIRDFKSYTSKKFIQHIEQNNESRSEWLLGRQFQKYYLKIKLYEVNLNRLASLFFIIIY
ncbi:transposase [Carboxylicivirga sp. M1479]|uniref:transposase n=1 Tax=Carboxylicivirga sp. M1479 TaxID=2594476 RepID=UPI00163D7672|nr:transposase [Carboxylicivirga sp. M1479]